MIENERAQRRADVVSLTNTDTNAHVELLNDILARVIRNVYLWEHISALGYNRCVVPSQDFESLVLSGKKHSYTVVGCSIDTTTEYDQDKSPLDGGEKVIALPKPLIHLLNFNPRRSRDSEGGYYYEIGNSGLKIVVNFNTRTHKADFLPDGALEHPFKTIQIPKNLTHWSPLLQSLRQFLYGERGYVQHRNRAILASALYWLCASGGLVDTYGERELKIKFYETNRHLARFFIRLFQDTMTCPIDSRANITGSLCDVTINLTQIQQNPQTMAWLARIADETTKTEYLMADTVR